LVRAPALQVARKITQVVAFVALRLASLLFNCSKVAPKIDFADKPTELRNCSNNTLRVMLCQARDNVERTSGERRQYWEDCVRYAQDEIVRRKS
jgi:hypothetical protein